VDNALTGWGSDRKCFPAEVRAAYIAALRDPATAHAICEEYRAAARLTLRKTWTTAGLAAALRAPRSRCGARVDRSITGMWMQAGRSVSGVIGPTT
jgi:hypothetical protein